MGQEQSWSHRRRGRRSGKAMKVSDYRSSEMPVWLRTGTEEEEKKKKLIGQ